MQTNHRSIRPIRSFLVAALAATTLAPTAIGCAASSDAPIAEAQAEPSEPTGAMTEGESVDGYLTSAPAVCSTSPGHYEIFVQSSGNTIYRRPYDNGVWGSWQQILGLAATSKPACVANSTGHLDLFARGPDGALWYSARSTMYGAFGAWKSLGGWITDGASVVADVVGHLDVFAQGGSNGMFHKKFRVEDVIPGGRFGGSDGWSDWMYMPGALISSAPAAVSWGPGRIDLFARELGSNNLLHNWSNELGDWWGGWENKGGGLTSGPAVTSRGYGWFTVYVKGGGDALWALPYTPSTGWGTFTYVPLEVTDALPITSDPAASALGNGCEHVFARDRNWQLFHRGCGELNKVKIQNLTSGAKFETTALDGFTSAYSSLTLGAAVTGPASWSTISLVDGRWPRELIALSKSPRPEDLSTTVPVLGGTMTFGTPVSGVSFASIPGYRPPTLAVSTDLGPFLSSSNVPWLPQSARLVDHGTCATRIPLRSYPESDSAFFVGIAHGLDTSMHQATDKMNASGAGVALTIMESKFTPSYITRTGSTDPGANLDGFATHQKFKWWKGTAVGDAIIEFTVDATYQITMRDGLLDVVPVTPSIVNVSTNALYDIGSLLNPVAQFFGTWFGGFINMIPGTFGKDDWVNLVPRSIPSTGGIVDQIKYSFDTMLPATIRAQIYAALLARDARNQPIGVGVCRADLDATSQRQTCFDQRLLFMKAVVKDKLVATGMTAAAADARALEITGGLHRDSFDCVPTSPGVSDGVCRWHPYFPRINVLPDRLEMVWYDGATPSADFALASLFAPPSVTARMCPDNSADAVTHPSTPIATYSWL